MEKPADEICAMFLDKSSCRNPVLIDQVIHILVLDRFLYDGFLFVQHRRGLLLGDKDLYRVNEILNAILIAARRSLLACKDRTDRVIETGLRGDILDVGDIPEALGLFPDPFLEPGVSAVLDQFIDFVQEHAAVFIADEIGADQRQLFEIRR